MATITLVGEPRCKNVSKTEVGVTGHDVILSMVFFDRLDPPTLISRGLLGHLSCEIGVWGVFLHF